MMLSSSMSFYTQLLLNVLHKKHLNSIKSYGKAAAPLNVKSLLHASIGK
jgi:hypothetical protein